MGVFTYMARDDAGKVIEGEITALDTAEAARAVRSEGHYVVKVEPKGRVLPERRALSETAQRGGATGRFRPTDLIFFTNQLAVMVDTGVSLSDALDACVHEGNSPRFAAALDSVIEQVRGGSEFSAALAEHPKVFPKLYVSLMKASEASGQFAPILVRLADHLERQRDMRKKIRGALTYPIVMLLFAIGVTVFQVAYVLPKFAKIYAGREDKLPVLTKVLLAFSDAVVNYGLYVLAGLIAAGIGLFFYFRTPEGRWKAERLKLSLPLIGTLFHRAYLARSLRTLGTMIQSGVSMLESLRLTIIVCGSQYYERMWAAARDRIERGQQVSEALADNPHVPRAVVKMLNAGERSGRLGMVMDRVASFSEAELNVTIKTLTSLIEPAIVAFLGVVVGGLVLALLLPIFTISKAL
ncbi:MAG: type II secretion system F family protein [Phycisphaerae bacterium]